MSTGNVISEEAPEGAKNAEIKREEQSLSPSNGEVGLGDLNDEEYDEEWEHETDDAQVSTKNNREVPKRFAGNAGPSRDIKWRGRGRGRGRGRVRRGFGYRGFSHHGSHGSREYDHLDEVEELPTPSGLEMRNLKVKIQNGRRFAESQEGEILEALENPSLFADSKIRRGFGHSHMNVAEVELGDSPEEETDDDVRVLDCREVLNLRKRFADGRFSDGDLRQKLRRREENVPDLRYKLTSQDTFDLIEPPDMTIINSKFINQGDILYDVSFPDIVDVFDDSQEEDYDNNQFHRLENERSSDRIRKHYSPVEGRNHSDWIIERGVNENLNSERVIRNKERNFNQEGMSQRPRRSRERYLSPVRLRRSKERDFSREDAVARIEQQAVRYEERGFSRENLDRIDNRRGRRSREKTFSRNNEEKIFQTRGNEREPHSREKLPWGGINPFYKEKYRHSFPSPPRKTDRRDERQDKTHFNGRSREAPPDRGETHKVRHFNESPLRSLDRGDFGKTRPIFEEEDRGPRQREQDRRDRQRREHRSPQVRFYPRETDRLPAWHSSPKREIPGHRPRAPSPPRERLRSRSRSRGRDPSRERPRGRSREKVLKSRSETVRNPFSRPPADLENRGKEVRKEQEKWRIKSMSPARKGDKNASEDWERIRDHQERRETHKIPFLDDSRGYIKESHASEARSKDNRPSREDIRWFYNNFNIPPKDGQSSKPPDWTKNRSPIDNSWTKERNSKSHENFNSGERRIKNSIPPNSHTGQMFSTGPPKDDFGKDKLNGEEFWQRRNYNPSGEASWNPSQGPQPDLKHGISRGPPHTITRKALNPPREVVIVRGLAEDVSDIDIRRDISNCGLWAKDVRIVLDEAKRSRGFAFITFTSVDEASRWIELRNGVLNLRPNNHASMDYSNNNSKDWDCVKCGLPNFRYRLSCFRCNRVKENCIDGFEESCPYPTNALILRNLASNVSQSDILSNIMRIRGSRNIRLDAIKMGYTIEGKPRNVCFLQLTSVVDAMELHRMLASEQPLTLDGIQVIVSYCRLERLPTNLDSTTVGAPLIHSTVQPHYGSNLQSTSGMQTVPSSSNAPGSRPPKVLTAPALQELGVSMESLRSMLAGNYTEKDIPTLAAYCAKSYAKNPQEHAAFLRYYTQQYKDKLNNKLSKSKQ